MKRALRRYQKDVKHVHRLKQWANSSFTISLVIPSEDDGMSFKENPTWVELKEYGGVSHKLKTMSTICSCSMCACDKYNRVEQKKQDKTSLQLGLEDYYDSY